MDDVTAQAETVNQPAEETAPAVGPAETKPAEQAPEAQAEGRQPANPERGDVNIALRQERALRRDLERKLAEVEASKRSQGYETDDSFETVSQHPAFQELAVKTAEYELKDGAKDILENYPNVPKEVERAILKNPRGFVKSTTRDVPNALLDIQEYLEETFGGPQTPQFQPKPLPIAGSNQVTGTGPSQNVEVQNILKKPPENWTPEDIATVEAFRKNK